MKRSKNSSVQLFGIVGYPLAHTLSPVMQEAAFSALGLKAYYLPFEIHPRIFRRTMKSLSRTPLEGFNVTVPYKQAVIPHLDGISREARSVGAVNTVYRTGRKWLGTNTDVPGFLAALKNEGEFRIRSKKIAVFGAGGASRAIVYALASSRAASVTVINRRLDRAVTMVRGFKRQFPKIKFQAAALKEKKAIQEILRSADLVVNATSLGLKKKDPEFLPAAWIPKAKKKRILFYDLIYGASKTSFLKNAARKGHRTMNGLSMLLYQGALAFKIWTGRKAPVNVMAKSLEEAVSL